jgi:hypothetical protein
LLGPSIALPIRGGRLRLGTWQQVVAINHDNRSRRRTVEVTLSRVHRDGNASLRRPCKKPKMRSGTAKGHLSPLSAVRIFRNRRRSFRRTLGARNGIKSYNSL